MIKPVLPTIEKVVLNTHKQVLEVHFSDNASIYYDTIGIEAYTLRYIYDKDQHLVGIYVLYPENIHPSWYISSHFIHAFQIKLESCNKKALERIQYYGNHSRKNRDIKRLMIITLLDFKLL